MDAVTLERFVARVREINRPKRVEESVALRSLVFVTTVYPFVALAAIGVVSGAVAAAASAVAAVGSWLAYRWRHRNPGAVKVALSFGLFALLALYLAAVRGGDTRQPLVMLLTGVLLLHCFDMPERKDLLFSVLASVVLVTVGGTYAGSAGYLAWIAGLALLVLVVSLLDAASREGVDPDALLRRHGGAVVRSWARAAGVTALVAMVVFFVVPRPRGAFYTGLQSGMERAVRPLADFAGQPVSPFYSRLGSGFPKVAGGSYFGAAPVLDLNVRGRLSDAVVYRVKTTAPAYYRIAVFTKYNGRTWEPGGLGGEPVQVAAPGDEVPLLEEGFPMLDRTEELSIVSVEREVSNAIPSPYRPAYVYLPFQQYWVDHAQVLRAPFVIPAGTVFSIESERHADVARSIERARASFGSLAPKGRSVDPTYLDVPASVPRRVRKLARTITAGTADAWDRTQAILDFLARNYRYDLDIPYFPLDADAVDYFLFEQKAGFCEHFASAFVVLARLSGVPARLVTGYAEGTFDPLTGSYVIRESDGHAWAEVFLYGVGWVEVEPTPGFADPYEVSGRSQNAETLRALLEWLRSRGLGDALPSLAEVRGALGLALVLAGAGALFVSAFAWRRVGRAVRKRSSPPENAVRDLLWELERHGYARQPGETLRALLGRTPYADAAGPFLQAYERWAYGGGDGAGLDPLAAALRTLVRDARQR